MDFTKYVAKQFSRPTGLGGKLSCWVMNRMNQKQYRSVLKALKPSSHDKILDIGFGNGFLIQKIAKSSPCQIYGVELSSDMVIAAKNRNKTSINRGLVHLKQGDVMHLPFHDHLFDKSYSVNTIYFWHDVGKGLFEVRRVTKPQGIFVNAFYTEKFLNQFRYTDFGFAKYTPKQLENYAVQSGWQMEEMLEIKKDSIYCMILKNP